jgi:hypothetical protein
VRIAILVEGRTETAFKPYLLTYLNSQLAGKMPKLDFVPQKGRIPTESKLRRIVNYLLNDTKRPADAVIALTDVYTGSIPPEFPTADDAKRKMRKWVGPEKRFHPHVALHDFEAWLLPYWEKIQRLTGSNRNAPGPFPEQINHGKSPACWLEDVFRTGSKTSNYIKTRDAGRILENEDLAVAIEACPELEKLVETITELSNPRKKRRTKG